MTMSLIDPEYRQGLEDGYIDGCVISQPCNEGEHSLERYHSVSYKYKSSISPFLTQTQYTLGYGNGVDAAAIYLGIAEDLRDE